MMPLRPRRTHASACSPSRLKSKIRAERPTIFPQYAKTPCSATTQQQLAALRKPEVKELIQLQRELATERELRQQILTKVQDAKEDLGRNSPKTPIQEILQLAHPENLTVGATEFQTILHAAAAANKAFGTAEAEVKTQLTAFEKVVSAQITSWKAKELEAQKKIDAKRRELEALKVSFDMSYISKLAKDEASHEQNIKNLNTWKPHLIEMRKQRLAALQ